jgi:hypothetical protein
MDLPSTSHRPLWNGRRLRSVRVPGAAVAVAGLAVVWELDAPKRRPDRGGQDEAVAD